MSKEEIKESYLRVAPALLFLLFALTTPLTSDNGGFGFDGTFYASMVDRLPENAKYFSHPPYCWRVLTPFLASLLPLPPLAALGIVNMLFTLGMLYLFFFVLRELKFPPLVQLTTLALYGSLFFAVQAAFYTPAMIDPLSHLFMWLVILLSLQKRYTLTLLVVSIAAFQKESILFVTPIAYLIRAKQDGEYQRNLLYFALLIVCALIPVGILRVLIEPSVQYHPEAVLRLTFIKQFGSLDFYPRFLVGIFAGLGVIPLLLLSLRQGIVTTLKEHPYLAAFLLVGAVQLLGGTCKARLFMGMVPGLVLLLGFLITEQFSRLEGDARALFSKILLFAVSLHFFLNLSGVSFMSEVQLRNWVLPTYSPYPLTESFYRIILLVAAWFPLHFLLTRSTEKSGE